MNKELAIECIKTQRQFVDDLTKEAFDVAIDLLKQQKRTGRWQVSPNGYFYRCEYCGKSRDRSDARFCWYCGARMEEEK